MRALLVGGAPPWPFVGAFRVHRRVGGTSVYVAGRTGHADPVEAWAAAEAARVAFAGAPIGNRHAAVTAVFEAFRRLSAPVPALLVLAQDEDGVVVSACGLTELRRDGVALVEADHPLLSPAGLPERVGFYREDSPGRDYVGVPVGAAWPVGDVARACGA